MKNFLKRTWAEIDLDALDGNICEIRKLAGKKEIIAIVKANAYGHDDSIICTELYKLGITHFAVSNLWEAEDLRKILCDAEILIFGYTENEFMQSIIDNNFIQTVGSTEYAKELGEYAKSHGKKARVHIKINTGMSRVGIDSEKEIDEILATDGLCCEGAYTHFAVADSLEQSDITYTNAQQEKLLRIAKGKGLKIHSQNSGGILYHPEFEGDFVRAGIIMYGLMPNFSEKVPMKMKPVMCLKSAICQLKEIPVGTTVSYGRTYKADKTVKLALVPVGYADGYSRFLSNKGKVIINNKFAPIVGRVCMDQMLVDISDIDGVKVGDIATLYSSDEPSLSVDSIAEELGTIGYELTCNVGHRVPRVAIRNGEVTDVVRYG